MLLKTNHLINLYGRLAFNYISMRVLHKSFQLDYEVFRGIHYLRSPYYLRSLTIKAFQSLLFFLNRQKMLINAFLYIGIVYSRHF